MLWALFYISILLGVWGFYLFRDDKNKQDAAKQPAAQPEVQESSFDRIRRMRELSAAETPQYIMARHSGDLSIPDHLIESIQHDITAVAKRALNFMNRDRDRYIWLVATMVVVTMFIQAAYRHTESSYIAAAESVPQASSWSQLQPLATKPLYDADVAKQVESKEVFKILFKDFPRDRARFIHEFTSVLSMSEDAQRDKWQEMDLVMEQYHLRKYIATASDDAVLAYAQAKFEILKAMFALNQQICQEFMSSPRDYFTKARGVVGRDKFADMVKTIPAAIVASRTTPQAAPDVAKAEQVKKVLQGRIQNNNYSFVADNSDCGRQLAYYDEVLKLPPTEASLVLRYDLSR